jgi:Uma2 family endonuclease
MTIATKPLTLAEFLLIPETKPVSEYINGRIHQKSMPKSRHSRLQGRLLQAINQVVEEPKIAAVFPELRCSFGNRSIVPDLVVLNWDRLEFDDRGEPVDDVVIAPDWTIEILSPGQQSNRVIGNILHCLEYGCQLGWLLDPDDRSILIVTPDRQIQVLADDRILPILANIPLSLTAVEIFSWLKMN